MSKLSVANLKKTAYYLKRNGLRNTVYAATERVANKESYSYSALSAKQIEEQETLAQKLWEESLITFSLVVPTYRTSSTYLKELIDSVVAQTYPEWELILADATEDESVGRNVELIRRLYPNKENRIRYVKLEKNEGISGNTNEALSYAQNEYVGLLDHDDILTRDALYEMAQTIFQGKAQGKTLQFVYSDEDKCDGKAEVYYEPHFKEDFNYDLLLSNNYICHFLVMKRELIQALRFRPEYDGAQDYDLVLRAVRELQIPAVPDNEKLVGHVGKVLYHWRCHSASTAENPQSKAYAYEAGKRALEDHIKQCGFRGKTEHLKHVGFYVVNYTEDIFATRMDLGAIGGPLIRGGKIRGGRMSASGEVFYNKLLKQYSGYMHRAVLTQDAEAIDIRNMCLRKELWPLFEEVVGVPYQPKQNADCLDVKLLPRHIDYVAVSLKLCKAIREQGYRILWRREND